MRVPSTTNMERLPVVISLLFIGIFLTNTAGVFGYRQNPLKNPEICGRPFCDATENKFNFKRNVVYRYDYELQVRSEFHGSGQNVSDIHVIASVEVQFPLKCEGLLRITSVEVKDKIPTPPKDEDSQDNESEDPYAFEEPEEIPLHPKNEDMAEEISRYEMRFAFHDGFINELCPHDEESVWVMNIKRGIISALQNTMPRFDIDHYTKETDISGECDVHYQLIGNKDTSLLVQKRKTIDSCKHRNRMHSILQTVPYDFRENYAAWPVLKSESYCNMSIDHHIYNGLVCYERHLVVPFSNNQSGAVTTSRLSLVLSDEEEFEMPPEGEELPSISKRRTLLFDHTPSRKPTHDEIKASREFLIQMCKLGFPDIQRDYPDKFSKFLSTTRLLTHSALTQLLARAGSICDNGKNHVLDSLPYISSTASVQVMKDQIVKRLVPKETVSKWMASFAFLVRPDAEMVAAAYALMEFGRDTDNSDFILSPTAIAHTYCKYHDECAENESIIRMMEFLEGRITRLMNKGSFTRADRERMMISIKGLGNMGVVTEEFKDILYQIIEDPLFPMEIRLETIAIHRRLDCKSSQEYFLGHYRNMTMNTEIRIASYLQMMRCPDYQSIQEIKKVLQEEEVNQVGSYVWSHLTNLAKASSPIWVEAQGLLIDGDLGSKFHMDVRKFSRNYEHSLFFDEYNFGVNADSNVIFSTDSYLPRTLNFNFTVDLFGESVNLLELSTRIEGFEHFVESLFGPKGDYNREWFQKKMDFIPDYIKEKSPIKESDLKLDALSNLRFRRDVPDQPRTSRGVDPKEQLEASVDALKNKNKYNNNNPRAEFGMRIFGNDLKYKTIEGPMEALAMASKFHPLNYIREILSGREISYTKSGIFLDLGYAVPMTSGLPLSITALGASSVDIRMSGGIEADNFKKHNHLDLDFKVKPSVSLDVVTTMKAEFFQATSGIRVKSNLFSSSNVETKLKVRGFKLVSFQFSLPQERNDVFSAHSELLVMKYERDVPQKGIEKRYSNSTCTWPVIGRALGLQLCADYSLPDVSNYTNVPSLIMSGPITIDVHIDKADPTAKEFLFEFRWESEKNDSAGSFVFQTPHSKIERHFSANLTTSDIGHNMTMAFRNGDITHTMMSLYKNTPREKKLEVLLNLNGQKSLSVETGYNRTDFRNGFYYYPTFFLIVNDEKIVGLAGHVKLTSKKNVNEWYLDLIFETKRLQSKLMGYVTKTAASVSTNMQMKYQFYGRPEESIKLEGELANRSQRGQMEYNGNLKLETTAYPHFNFAFDTKYISALGHIDWLLQLNNAPDLKDPNYTLATRLIFARHHGSDHGRTAASIEITRPRSKTDLKGAVVYKEKSRNGTEHNLHLLGRYSKGKEMTMNLSVLFPRRHFFAVDSALNITIPGLDSCTATFKLNEKARKEYNVDFTGTWFSGHSIAITGLYRDRSSVIKTFHHFKLNVQSPSFQETLVDLTYSRDEAELHLITNVMHGDHPYAVEIRYSEDVMYQSVTFASVKWKDKIFSGLANMTSRDPKQLFIEIHLDKYRDIHLTLLGLSNELRKEASVEFKWDANRDPSQKLVLSAEFNTPSSKSVNGRLILAYPERTFSGTVNYTPGDPVSRGHARLGWSATEAIDVSYEQGHRYLDVQDMWLKIRVGTPFDGWRRNSLQGGLYYENNLFLMNSSMVWAEDQNLSFETMANYMVNETLFNTEFRTALNSTIMDVPTIGLHFKHSYDQERIITEITIKNTAANETTNTYSVMSGWKFNNNQEFYNVSGSLGFVSPYEGCTTGALVTMFSFSDKKRIVGAMDFDLEDKKFTMTVEGHLIKLTDNMLEINITTPIDRFRKITGKFGINDKIRHLVAQVKAPTGSLGIEMLFNVISTLEFDVAFELASPFEALERILLIAKLNNDRVDFRGGWNKMNLGFVGVWRWVTIKDFEYSYRVYTPLENFEDNGVVIKFVLKDELDMEVTLKLATYKLGVSMTANPPPKLVQDLRLKKPKEIQLRTLMDGEGSEESDDDMMDKLDATNRDDDSDDDGQWYMTYFEVDTIVYPTIRGQVMVTIITDYYFLYTILMLPQGNVVIDDRFYFPDYLTMKNTMNITTPFPAMRSVKSTFEMRTDLETTYIFGVTVDFLNRTNWVETGVYVNYSDIVAESRLHDVRLEIKTPLKLMPFLNLRGIVELEEGTYRGNLTGLTKTTRAGIYGALESDEKYLDTVLGFSVSAPLVPKYDCKLFFRRDTSDVDKSFESGVEVAEEKTFNFIHVAGKWNEGRHYLNASGNVQTTMLQFKEVSGAVLVTRQPYPQASLQLGYKDHNDVSNGFWTKASRVRENIYFAMTSPIRNFENVTLTGVLTPPVSAGTQSLEGNLVVNNEKYYLSGGITLYNDVPTNLAFKIKTIVDAKDVGSISYSISPSEGNYGSTFKGEFMHYDRYIQLSGGVAKFSPLNWNYGLSIRSSEPEVSKVSLACKLTPVDSLTFNGLFELTSPWAFLGLDRVKVNSKAHVTDLDGEFSTVYDTSSSKGIWKTEWAWAIKENMGVLIRYEVNPTTGNARILQTGISYKNPINNFQQLGIGAEMNVDDVWIFQTNGSLNLISAGDISSLTSVQLPEPVGDVHRFSARYRGNAGSNQPLEISYDAKYEAERAQRRLASRGHYRNTTDLQGFFRVEWGPDMRFDVVETNVQMLRKDTKREISARLATPFYLEDSVTASGSYDYDDTFHFITGKLFMPASNQVGEADVTFATISNAKGMFNTTTPFANLTWFKADFDFVTRPGELNRYIKAYWPDDTAIFKSTTQLSAVNLDRDLKGKIHIDFPVKTRHIADIDYSLTNRGELSNGAAHVKYNGDQVLSGKYTCKSESSAGFDKDVIDVEIHNVIRPIGVHYVASQKYGGAVSYDLKHAELFELGNSAMYNITGEFHSTNRETGTDYKFVAIHPNRTVILTSNYDFEGDTTKHKSRLELSPTVWIAYDWFVQNMTRGDNESQAFSFDLSYPKRSLGASGWYAVSKNAFDSDVAIKWHNKESQEDNEDDQPEPKVLKAALVWRNNLLNTNDRDNQTASLSLGHPSFEKNITVKGLWYRGKYDLLRAFLEAEYCDDPDHLLTIEAVVKDNTRSVGYRNYTYFIKSIHEISELNLDVEGSVGLRPGLYETSSYGQYKRGYLPLQKGLFVGMVDLKEKEILYEKTSPHKETKFWGKAGGRYPEYTMNATLLDTPESDMVGAFLLDFDDKLIKLDLNLTPDATQNLRLIGHIPDARSASFDLWRDYEDIHVVDIASYIRMNHSRLVTSKIIWRPRMKSDIKAYFKNMANAFYESLSQGVDSWVRDITNEVKDSVMDIWNNADPYTNNFIEDLKELKVLEEDVEALRVFLNSSYQANDFYIKSAVNFTITLIDELALRSHIKNVPKIFTEMWQVMGESGQALRRSVKWIIETIKTSYRKAVELISRILHGESLDQVSGIMEKMVEKYDKFIKDLHLSVIKYAENVYNNVVNMLSNYWKKMLQNIEPTIIRILHYVETTLWNASKEVFDFFYKRTNELVESPYFNKVSNFTQDLDKFYKDIMQNDVHTNIKIYSEMFWNFLKDRYFKLVPFSNEIYEVYVELKEEIQELQKSKHVEFIVLRLKEVRDKIDWLADELQLEKRLLSVYKMMKQKLMHMAQTALQADSRYREAKTKFVFDPEAGIIDLEQKLPMSWHSFNSTPLFEEIPEFKLVGNVQNAFAGTNFSVWSLYYEYKRYMDPDTWLPPFKSQSMIIGSRHYLSFDNHLVGLNAKYGVIEANRKPDQCSYLLATDWYEKNFTLTLEPTTLLVENNLVATRKLALLTDGELVYIDIVGQTVRIGNSTTLPAKLENTIFYQLDDILHIESETGFNIQCNLQYDICTMQLEGWYFGKTSGLLGTMNNEPFDDTLTSLQRFPKSDDEFVKSWALNECSQTPKYEDAKVFDFHSVMTCDDMFRNKVSYFASCFSVVDPMPYYRMCIDLMENTFTRVVPTKNPSPKGACTAALAYIEVCNQEKTPLRIPDSCIKCELINGTYVNEGDFISLEKEAVPKTTDVVFIVEAKRCNQDLATKKSMSTVVNSLEAELQANGLKDNKFAVVAFGGEKPFDKPRPVIYENRVFADASSLLNRLAHIRVSDDGENKDIFQALSVSANLNFRPGASKTFILLPCSECSTKDMRFDYSSLLQLMLENGITMHVLTDHELPLEKSRMSKIFYGIDKDKAYTKHDLKEYKGSTELRKQVRLPKKKSNSCSPLAIETKGSVFTGNKLRSDMKNRIKKFSTIFAKRVAASAVPNSCQNCECTGHNSGVAYMICTSCERDTSDGFDDYGFDEDMSSAGSLEMDVEEELQEDDE